MKNKISLVITAVAMLLFAACTNHKKDLKAAIKTAQAAVTKSMNAGKMDNYAVNHLDSLMVAYATKYPDDSLSPKFLLQTAEMLQMQREYGAANKMLDKIVTDYPGNKVAPYALFLNGFIFENYENDLSKAKNRYESFLNKYPTDSLAKDVKSSLKNLGKSPEDIIKENNPPDSTMVKKSKSM